MRERGRKRERARLQVFTFRAPSVSPIPSSPPLLHHHLLLRLLLLLLLLLRFAVVVLYSWMKRSGRLSPLIASRVTLREALTFGDFSPPRESPEFFRDRQQITVVFERVGCETRSDTREKILKRYTFRSRSVKTLLLRVINILVNVHHGFLQC